MMTKQTEEALKMAIEWVEGWKGIAPSKIELLRVLREALEQPTQEPINLNCKSVQKRLATQWGYVKEHPAQEPVALVIEDKLADWSKPYVAVKWNKVDFEIGTKFYTHPAPSWQGNKEFVGLSEEEMMKLANKYIDLLPNGEIFHFDLFARAIEQALMEKNT